MKLPKNIFSSIKRQFSLQAHKYHLDNSEYVVERRPSIAGKNINPTSSDHLAGTISKPIGDTLRYVKVLYT